MAAEWISAQSALNFLKVSLGEQAAEETIIGHARAGLLAAKANRLDWDGKKRSNVAIPRDFWKTEAVGRIKAEWSTGDFCNVGDLNEDKSAYGVSFDFLPLIETVPAADRASALRAISVIADDDWISARELQLMFHAARLPTRMGWEIIEPCKLGLLAGKAMRAEGEISSLGTSRKTKWVAIEWDIPLWFWRDFTNADRSTHDWMMGVAKGRGQSPDGPALIKLSGIHFHRSGLVNIGLEDQEEPSAGAEQSKAGRKPTYDWADASRAIWGQIVRGELIPDNQAQIERAFIAHLTKGDKEPSESTVRPYAKEIWTEFSKA